MQIRHSAISDNDKNNIKKNEVEKKEKPHIRVSNLGMRTSILSNTEKNSTGKAGKSKSKPASVLNSKNKSFTSKNQADAVKKPIPETRGKAENSNLMPEKFASEGVAHNLRGTTLKATSKPNKQGQEAATKIKVASVSQDRKLRSVENNPDKSSKNMNRKHKNNNNKSWMWVLYVIAVLAIVFMIYVFYDFFAKPKENIQEVQDTGITVQAGIIDNIYFGDIALAGLDFTEFEQALAASESPKLASTQIDFVNEKDETLHKSLKVADLGYSYDAKVIYDHAVDVSDLIKEKEAEITEKSEEPNSAGLGKFIFASPKLQISETELGGKAELEGDKFKVLPVYQVDQTKLEEAVADIRDELSKEGEEAGDIKFNLETLQFEYPDAGSSFTIEADLLLEKIKAIFEKKQLEKKVILPFEEVESLSQEEINQKLGLIASASTRFATYDPPRDENVRRVTEMLMGYVVMPGEIFSYWDSVNPVTAENGYQTGYQIGSDGQPEPVIGGGICQGSSTLYNAVVFSDLEIIERNNHTVVIPYLGEGLDAMVSGWSDFKFKNNTDYPLAIVGTVVNTEYVQFDIYGRKLEPGLEIRMEAFFEGTAEPGAPKRVENKGLAPGTERVVTPEIVGSYWTTDKVYYKDGVEINRVHLNKSYYWPYNAVVEYGPEKEITPTTPPATTAPPATTTTTAPPATTTTTAPPETTTTTAPPVTTPKPEPSPEPSSTANDAGAGVPTPSE